MDSAAASAGSPVIDAGKNAAVPRSVLVDMGAFERQVPLAADLDGDGAVGASDLGILLGA